MPPPPTAVLYPSAEVFRAIWSYAQAWPVLRAEITRLERHNTALVKENAAIAGERDRLRDASAALRRDLSNDAAGHLHRIDALRDQLAACRRQLGDAARELASIPERVRLAERVCSSVNPHHNGSGSSWAWYDAGALDAWKAAKP